MLVVVLMLISFSTARYFIVFKGQDAHYMVEGQCYQLQTSDNYFIPMEVNEKLIFYIYKESTCETFLTSYTSRQAGYYDLFESFMSIETLPKDTLLVTSNCNRTSIGKIRLGGDCFPDGGTSTTQFVKYELENNKFIWTNYTDSACTIPNGTKSFNCDECDGDMYVDCKKVVRDQ